MLTLSALGVRQRWTDYAHFVRVRGPSKVNKLCSLCQRWGSSTVNKLWSFCQRWGPVKGEQTMLTLSELGGSMNGGQTMLTLSELRVRQR